MPVRRAASGGQRGKGGRFPLPSSPSLPRAQTPPPAPPRGRAHSSRYATRLPPRFRPISALPHQRERQKRRPRAHRPPQAGRPPRRHPTGGMRTYGRRAAGGAPRRSGCMGARSRERRPPPPPQRRRRPMQRPAPLVPCPRARRRTCGRHAAARQRARERRGRAAGARRRRRPARAHAHGQAHLPGVCVEPGLWPRHGRNGGRQGGEFWRREGPRALRMGDSSRARRPRVDPRAAALARHRFVRPPAPTAPPPPPPPLHRRR
jgi:hypothetical protein